MLYKILLKFYEDSTQNLLWTSGRKRKNLQQDYYGSQNKLRLFQMLQHVFNTYFLNKLGGGNSIWIFILDGCVPISDQTRNYDQ